MNAGGRLQPLNNGQSVFIGEGAGLNDDLSDNTNIAIGAHAMRFNSSGFDNVALGASISPFTSGSSNTVVGNYSFINGTTGSGNTVLGIRAGRRIETGSNNTILGANVTGLAEDLSNTVIIADGEGNRRIYVDNQGNMGIGTTAPTAGLHVNGLARFESLGTGALQTDAAGNISVSSDERLKDITNEYTAGLESILGLKPINYHWKATSGFDQEHSYTGFSAQNVQKHIPSAVGVDNREYLTLSDRPILATLVNAVKALKAKNEAEVKEIAQTWALQEVQAKEIQNLKEAMNLFLSKEKK